MESETPNLDYIKEEVGKLKSLLDDAHPGMREWWLAYGKQVEKLLSFWNQEQSDANSS